MKAIIKSKINGGKMEINDAIPVKFPKNSPTWITKLSLITHKTPFYNCLKGNITKPFNFSLTKPFNFSLTETTTGLSVIAECRTRKQAIEHGVKRLEEKGEKLTHKMIVTKYLR